MSNKGIKEFGRDIDPNVLKDMLDSPLWKNYLKKDCKGIDPKGEDCKPSVFLAVRNGWIGFYHKGGKLFGYREERGFETHIKYAAIASPKDKKPQDDQDKKESPYVNKDDLEKFELIKTFEEDDAYTGIKNNCARYSKGTEAEGVSEMCNKNSYLSDNDIVVLDIEVSFENKEKKKNKIDILLYSKKFQTLKFVEAKLFSNSEIWSSKKPKVIEQIERYEEQIKLKKKEIIEAYEKYIEIINKVFDKSIPPPKVVEDEVALLIFDFDKDQRSGRLKNSIKDNEAFRAHKHKLWPVGGIEDIVLKNFWDPSNPKIINP